MNFQFNKMDDIKWCVYNFGHKWQIKKTKSSVIIITFKLQTDAKHKKNNNLSFSVITLFFFHLKYN